MMIGNKKDSEDQRDVSYEEASNFAKENGNGYELQGWRCFAYLPSCRAHIPWNKR